MRAIVPIVFISCAAPVGPTGSPPALPVPVEIRGALPVAFVRIEPPAPTTAARAVERAGLITALFELGLADLEAVVPHVGDLPPSPGMLDLVLEGSEAWTARLALDFEPWELRVEFCDPEGGCLTHASSLGTPAEPWPALAALLGSASNRMLRSPIGGARDAWQEPVSPDPYAVLVAGRGAATFYGMRDETPENAIGDPRRDPIARAVFIDPGMAVSDWILARREVARGNSVTARSWLVRASLARPSSLVLPADEATALAAEDKAESAGRVWRDVLARSPDDLRFVAPTARADLVEGALTDAAELLDRWPTEVLNDRSMAELRVSLAEAGHELAGYDELLATWQRSDPANAEPVRRRVRIRVREAAYADALALVPELDQRGADDEAVGLRVALGAALGRWDTAAAEAEAAGRIDVARRLRARAALNRSPNVVPPILDGDRSAEALTAVGWARMRGGDAAGALKDADEALRARKYGVDALALRADAARAAATQTIAERARQELAAVRPQGSFFSPRTAPGATDSATHEAQSP